MKISGKVIEGQKVGKKIGFPTANISLIEQIDPGIYAGRVSVGDKKFDSAIYVSSRRPDILEAHILDFVEDIYGKEIAVKILKKIRNDKFFSDGDDVAEIINNDITAVRQFLNSNI